MKDETGAECDDILEGPGAMDTQQKIADYVSDIVCPRCYKRMANASVMPLPDRYGRKLRKYIGFCTHCSLGNNTIQFERDGRWVIHQYQVYTYAGQNNGIDKWVTLNDLPEPAPIVTGPGGEYDKQIRLKKEDVVLLSTLRRGLECFAAAIESFMKHFELKE